MSKEKRRAKGSGGDGWLGTLARPGAVLCGPGGDTQNRVRWQRNRALRGSKVLRSYVAPRYARATFRSSVINRAVLTLVCI